MGKNMLKFVPQDLPAMKSLVFTRELVSLRAMVTSAGFEDCHHRSYDWHGLRRGNAPFFLIQHTLDGGGRLLYKNNEYDISQGDTMILQFPDNNRYWLPQGEHWSFFWLCINGREAIRLLSQVLQTKGPILRLQEDRIGQIAQHCRDVVNGNCQTAGHASTIAYAVTMILIEELTNTTTRESNQTHPGLQRAVEYIRANLQTPLDVHQLAGIAGYSPYHFSRLFKQAQSLSPGKFIQRERLTKAVRMMQTGTTSVGEVARACGFTDSNYFAKAFRTAFGTSPTAFMQDRSQIKITHSPDPM